jgi:hypothetical protein
MAFGWGARKVKIPNQAAEILPKMQTLPPDEVLRIVRKILDTDSETYPVFIITDGQSGIPSGKTQTVAIEPPEKLIRIGVMLMCIETQLGKEIAAEIWNRIFISNAMDVHPSKEYDK